MDLEQYIINQHSVWRGKITKIDGVMIPNPQKFIIRPLSRQDSDKMSNLSSTIYNHLNKGEECFIHKHNKEYYQQVFDNKDISYIGIFVGSELVGMSYSYLCDNKEKLDNEIPNNPINFFQRHPNMIAVSLGADCVHPKYRGNNLNKIMIQYRLEQAKAQGYTDAFSIIDRNNNWNMPPYFNNGFKMFATTIDPADGGQIALMHYNIKYPENYSKVGINVAYNNFTQIDKLISKGFIGGSYNSEHKTINFIKKQQAENIMLKPNRLLLINLTRGIRRV